MTRSATVTRVKTFLLDFLTNPKKCAKFMAILLLLEAILNVAIIWFVKYTEIDWIAYMQEVEGVINGTYDYTQLKGDTGPLVYPAGFVYLFTGFYYVTSEGRNIRLAQYIWAGLYLITIALVFNIYRKVAKLPPWAFIFMCLLSHRIHSIYVLRLFNDPVAMIFLYAAVNAMLYDSWVLAAILYSLGVSVKMNVLLFAPGFGVLMLRRHGLLGTIGLLTVCAAVQVLLGLPFLLENPAGYMNGAFDMGRQFMFKWTVNWRFLPVEVFSSRYFHVSLLVGHVTMIAIFYILQWSRLFPTGIFGPLQESGKPINTRDIVRTLFVSNFIGMAFSRSLHYQFYIWYFHTLHFLLWSVRIPNVYRVLILGAIELCWNTYPSTIYSSGGLHWCHAVILLGLLLPESDESQPDKRAVTAQKFD